MNRWSAIGLGSFSRLGTDGEWIELEGSDRLQAAAKRDRLLLSDLHADPGALASYREHLRRLKVVGVTAHNGTEAAGLTPYSGLFLSLGM